MASTVLPNGIIIPEKYSRDWYNDLYHNWQELDNLLGGGTPKDGTLTIQKNGSTAGTFSANQATNETINITVPTATSELTNDSNFVESSDLATVATSGSYTDLSDKPTIPTVNNATLTIQQNGTTVDTFTANSSSDKTVNIQCVDLTNNQTIAGNKEFTGTTTAHDLVPSATDTYNFGSSSYQWNNAYIKSLTINGVACGDILTHNVSEFVNVTGAQTIGGVKTFSDIPIVANGNSYVSKINANRADGTQAGFSAYNGFKIVCNNDSQGWDNTAFAIHIPEYSPTSASVGFKLYDCIEGSTSYKGFFFRKNNNNFQFSPTATNSTDLGTSTNKWKSFNGINPGALSLPEFIINLDTTNWNLTGVTVTYTPSSDGWLSINIQPDNNYAYVAIETGRLRSNSENTTGKNAMAFLAVRANIQVSITLIGASIAQARLVTCAGNV